jgi:hypothetical protein
MEVLEAEAKLSNVLGCVGEEDSVAVKQVVLPFADILDSMVVFLLDCL